MYRQDAGKNKKKKGLQKMSFSIQTNVNALVAQENLAVNSSFQSQTIQRLTSGFRINSSSDDAAGLAIANKFRSDTAELTQGVRNANDGVSQLQIVDGGLNNITKMLDRMKTLATQAASDTFTGDRGTLQTEYSKLISEIDRQAANVGLGGSAGTDQGRFVKSLGVYIGGASTTQDNASVTVDLTAGRVDTATLGISNTSISGTLPTTTCAADAIDKNAAGGKFLENTSQQFQISTGSVDKTFTIEGGSDGLTKDQFLSALNTQFSGTGVSASVDTDGKLTLASSNAFAFKAADAGTVAENAVTAGTYQKSTIVFNAGAVSNYDNGTLANSTTAMSITVNGTVVGTVTLGAADQTKDQIFTAFRDAVAGSGLEVVRQGDNMYLQGDKAFSVATVYTAGDGTATGGVAQFGATGTDNGAGTAPSASDLTSGAKDALTKLGLALATVGTVQGTVGAGQNMLKYAVSLASSQITNFSSAQSQIRDADVASEAANLTKAQVLQQASIAAMAQANSAPQAVLSLLRG
jgi:flagellin